MNHPPAAVDHDHYDGRAGPATSAVVPQAANLRGGATLVPVVTVNPMPPAVEPEVPITVNSQPEMFRLLSNESTGDLL